jgi:hypothetical protein
LLHQPIAAAHTKFAVGIEQNVKTFH